MHDLSVLSYSGTYIVFRRTIITVEHAKQQSVGTVRVATEQLQNTHMHMHTCAPRAHAPKLIRNGQSFISLITITGKGIKFFFFKSSRSCVRNIETKCHKPKRTWSPFVTHCILRTRLHRSSWYVYLGFIGHSDVHGKTKMTTPWLYLRICQHAPRQQDPRAILRTRGTPPLPCHTTLSPRYLRRSSVKANSCVDG